MTAPAEITLHSSWRITVGGYIGPLAFLALAAVAWARGGGGTAVVFGVLGVVLLLVLVLDVPIASRFRPDGVERRALLRQHLIEWSTVRQLTRARGKLLSINRFSGDPEMRVNRGGLVAVVGKRRYLLVDTAESRDEFDALMALLEEHAPGLVDEDLMPPPDVPPTYLYRRKRWRPGGRRSGEGHR